MRNQNSSSALRWISTSLFLFAIILVILQVVRFSRLRANFPNGMKIAGVPIGGLDRQSAAQRLLEAYTLPIELHYADSNIQLNPSIVGFELDLESMLAAADLERTRVQFWQSFLDFLWGRYSPSSEIPLRADFSEVRLRTYLEEEISQRYDTSPIPPLPIAGTVNFQPGKLGTSLDIDRAILPIENALRSTNRRIITLPLRRTLPSRPSFQNLEILLKQTITEISEFEGIAGLYFLDLQNAQEFHFAFNQGVEIPVNPDIAFTAASIIKIPVLVSVFKHIDGFPDSETSKLMSDMIEESGNEATDWLMEREIHPFLAPLDITRDMQSMGLINTFLGGYFYPGAPLLTRFDTPSNQREDVNTDPDLYNQTTPSDMGMLLVDIFHCAQNNGGALIAAFPEEITQSECKNMLNLLSRNKIGFLIEAGTPDGTQIAHKHGWVTTNGIMNTIGDAGIVFTPGGDYILVVFLYHPVQLIWDPAAELIEQLSRAVYNFYNLPEL